MRGLKLSFRRFDTEECVIGRAIRPAYEGIETFCVDSLLQYSLVLSRDPPRL